MIQVFSFCSNSVLRRQQINAIKLKRGMREEEGKNVRFIKTEMSKKKFDLLINIK